MQSLVQFINEAAGKNSREEFEQNILNLEGFYTSKTVADVIKSEKDLYVIQLTSKSKNVKWTSIAEFVDKTMEYVRNGNNINWDEKEEVIHYEIKDYKTLEKTDVGFGLSYIERTSKWLDSPVVTTFSKSDGFLIYTTSEENMNLIKDNIKTLVK